MSNQSKITQAWDEVEAAKANTDQAITLLNQSIETYNEALADAALFRDEVVGDMDDYMGERSEKWEESDSGQAYTSWKDEWEGLDLEPIDQIDMIDFNDPSHADELDGLADAPE